MLDLKVPGSGLVEFAKVFPENNMSSKYSRDMVTYTHY